VEKPKPAPPANNSLGMGGSSKLKRKPKSGPASSSSDETQAAVQETPSDAEETASGHLSGMETEGFRATAARLFPHHPTYGHG
jgi:hypothetical protein